MAMRTPPGSPWTRRHILPRQERRRWRADKTKRRLRKTPCLLRGEKRVAAGGEESAGGPDEIKRRDRISLAFLAPDIVEAIVAGHQPIELTAARLKRVRDLPVSWVEQHEFLDFAR